jgi:CDP-glucose 4,6-dehydratase
MGFEMRAVESVAMTPQFWRERRVMITGHTGFKGSWLSLWLQELQANLLGYALPAAEESLFNLAKVAEGMESVHADIRDYDTLHAAIVRFRPEVVFHLAAQALVRRSYVEPIETFAVNVMGTVNLLEAVRRTRVCRVVVNVTSDKCYENKEWAWGYREGDALGGHDPYSSSKGCAELATAAYRRSFFVTNEAEQVALATVRAGNVIGGGDFSVDRIIPDFMTAARNGTPLQIRNPDAVRPWQHVLEPVRGYLLLAEKLWANPVRYSDAWNFGPTADGLRPVRWIVEKLNEYCDGKVSWSIDGRARPHEAQLLTLDSSRARLLLGWKPRWTLEQALQAVVNWHDAYARHDALREVVLRQISDYEGNRQECPVPC